MTNNPFNNKNDKPAINLENENEPCIEDATDERASKKYIHPPAEPNGIRLKVPDESTKEKDYEVGYCKPPKKHQFQKGQSGNKKGRPKGRRDFKTDLVTNLNSKVRVNKDGKEVKLTRQELIIEAQTTKAAKGDSKSASLIFDLIARYLTENSDVAAERPITAGDQEILEAFASKFAVAPAKNRASAADKDPVVRGETNGTDDPASEACLNPADPVGQEKA